MNFDPSTAVFKPAGVVRPVEAVPVDARLSLRDRVGGVLVRCGIGRSTYRVAPGLYRIGDPSAESPVLVTANYKLSFDTLRSAIPGLSAWILVLDTKGVNVWCAAGKGTFGTEELIRRVRAAGLASRVSHRTLILPQLGAVGVAAHEAAKATGFRVVYGPVRAGDIPTFLAAGRRKTDDMRRVRFGLADRLAVAPVEAAHAWPGYSAAFVLAVALGFVGGAPGIGGVLRRTAFLASPFLVGAIAFPALLPLLPFRAFGLKGAVLGAVWTLGLAAAGGLDALSAASFALSGTAAVAFIAMNFTGSSTYTNLSGAGEEVRIGLPIMAAGAVAVLVLEAIGIALRATGRA